MDKTLELKTQIIEKLSSCLIRSKVKFGELTLWIKRENMLDAFKICRDDQSLKFDILVDLCGMDYREFKEPGVSSSRFGVVYHLLSTSFNWRVRLKVNCVNDEKPEVETATSIWPSSHWYEREAFDLFGIFFEN